MFAKMWWLALTLFVCSFIIREGRSQECVSGLMSAERVWQLSRVTGELQNYHNEQQQITPDMKFTCRGTVTKWIIGADWFGDAYFPEMQIWRESATDGVYTKIHGTTLSSRSIENSDVYEFSTGPLDVEPGDILGIYEPWESFFRVFYNELYGPRSYYVRTPGGVVPPGSTFNVNGPTILTHTDMPLVSVEITPTDGTLASDCVRSFASMEAIMYGVQYEPDFPIAETDRNQRVIPELKFTCHGFITKWIIGGIWLGTSNPLELQTWRSSDGDTYTKQEATTVGSLSGLARISYYEYTPSLPHEFNHGDVLGIFIPVNPLLRLLLEVEMGSLNYLDDTRGSILPPGGDFVLSENNRSPDPAEAIPLVAVEVSIPRPLPTPSSTGTQEQNKISSTSRQQETATPQVSEPTSIPAIGHVSFDSSQQSMQSMEPQHAQHTKIATPPFQETVTYNSSSDGGDSSGGQTSTGMLAGITVGAIVGVAMVIVAMVIAGIIVRRQMRKENEPAVREVEENQAYGAAHDGLYFPKLDENLAYGAVGNTLPPAFSDFA